MPVTVDYPEDLPCVSRIDGFGMTAAAAVIRTPFEAGNARLRRMHAVLPQEIALAWRCSNEDLHPLIAWLNTFGYDWFNLRLAGIEASELGDQSTPIAVRLMSDLQMTLMQFHRQNWWTVRATAEYQPPVATVVSTATPIEESSMMFIELTRTEPDPVYGEKALVNIEQIVGISRALDDSSTRLRALLVYPVADSGDAGDSSRTYALDQEWTLDSLTTEGPGSGRARLNTASQTAATRLWVHYVTADSIDVQNILRRLTVDADAYLQDKADGSKWAQFRVVGAVIDKATYFELPVAFDKGGLQIPAGRMLVIMRNAPAVSVQGRANSGSLNELVELRVKETPAEIAALVNQQTRAGTRFVGAPRVSPARVR
jgi:hypothetical protein